MPKKDTRYVTLYASGADMVFVYNDGSTDRLKASSMQHAIWWFVCEREPSDIYGIVPWPDGSVTIYYRV